MSQSKAHSTWAIAILIALILLGLIALGAALRWLGGDYLRARLSYCGQLTPPQAQTQFEACRERILSHATRIEAWKSEKGQYPIENLDPLPTCPHSGIAYRYLVSSKLQVAWLFCPGQVHGVANAPAYNFETHKVSDGPVEPRAKSWHRLQWLLETQNPQQIERAYEEIGSFEGNSEEALKERSEVLLALHRYKDALNLLDKLPVDKSNATLKIDAMTGLGRYQEALALNREYSGDREDMLQYLVGDDQAALTASRADSRGPRVLEFMIALANNRPKEAFETAHTWLGQNSYGRALSPFAVLTQVVVARHTGVTGHLSLSRESLRQALSQSQRCWPFPLLQLANREVDEATVEKACAGEAGRLTEYHTWAGLLQEAKGDVSAAKAHYKWTLDNGVRSYFEFRISSSRHGKIP